MSFGKPSNVVAVRIEKEPSGSELKEAALFAAHTIRSIGKQLIALAEYLESVARRPR